MNNTTINYYSDFLSNSPSLFVESENLKKVIEVILNQYQIDQEKYLWLIDNILNLDIAEKYHLDFIGKLVGQDRFLVNFNQEKYFGFLGSYQSETLGTLSDASFGGYWNSVDNFISSSARRLNDEEYKRIIKARIIYNNSDCLMNDLVNVVNLITNRTDNRISLVKHGQLIIKSNDEFGLLTYFFDRLELEDNILPITSGVSVSLE